MSGSNMCCVWAEAMRAIPRLHHIFCFLPQDLWCLRLDNRTKLFIIQDRTLHLLCFFHTQLNFLVLNLAALHLMSEVWRKILCIWLGNITNVLFKHKFILFPNFSDTWRTQANRRRELSNVWNANWLRPRNKEYPSSYN